MKAKLAQFTVSALGLALLMYSATRSLDLINYTLPPAQHLTGYAALAALDAGVLAWLFAYQQAARGQLQRAIAIGLVIVDLVGVVTAFATDTLLRAGERGLVATLDPNTVQLVIIVVAGVIAANISAVVTWHLADPESRRLAAQREAQDAIDERATAAIAQAAPGLANELAAGRAAAWLLDLRAANTPRLANTTTAGGDGSRHQVAPPEPAGLQPAPKAAARTNGHKKA